MLKIIFQYQYSNSSDGNQDYRRITRLGLPLIFGPQNTFRNA